MNKTECIKIRKANYNLCVARNKAKRALEEYNAVIHELLQPYIFTETVNVRVRLAPRKFGYIPEERKCLARYETYLDEDTGEGLDIERTTVIQRDDKLYEIDYEFWAEHIRKGRMVKRQEE